MVGAKKLVAPPIRPREEGGVHHRNIRCTTTPRRSIEPGGFPIVEANQIIVPGPLLKMTAPPVRRLTIIPKRVVGIEVPCHYKVGLRDPQCMLSEVSLIRLSDR